MVADDRRIALRGAREERLFVKVRAEEGQHQDGMTMGCSTLDVSPSGIRLSSEHALSEGSQLELWVDIQGCAGKFLLHGNVRWCMPHGLAYVCGVEIDADDTSGDFAEWQELFN